MIIVDRTALLCALCLVMAGSAFGQAVAIAEVTGTVTDPTGASIGGAELSMTETNKQLVRSVITGQNGRYTLANLPVGPYRLDVSAPGFKSYSRTGLVLQVGNNIQ